MFVHHPTGVLQTHHDLIFFGRHGQDRGDLLAQVRHCGSLKITMKVDHIDGLLFEVAGSFFL